MSEYYIKRQDNVSGPFTSGQIASGIESNKLVATDLIATAKGGPWEPITSFSEYIEPSAVTRQSAKQTSSPQPARQIPSAPSAPSSGDATGGVIPYKNPPALIAYYLGLFSLLPCVGLLLAIPALILGIVGLRARKKNPAVKGSVHAWIGIVLGGTFTLVWGGLIVLSLIGNLISN